MLKTQEDHDMMKSKYESYKDIEVVSIFFSLFSFNLTTMSFYGSDVLLNIESSLSFNFIVCSILICRIYNAVSVHVLFL